MLRKKITGAKYFSDSTKQMTNLNIATPIDKKDTNFSSSDILLAKDVVKLANSTNSEDIDKLKTSIASINEQITNDQKNITKNTNDISTLNSKFTGLFEVVTVLPDINDAQVGKIYCIKDISSSEDDNKYTEWVKIRTADDTYKFEKIGEFKAEPDLSGYAKLSGADFQGRVNINDNLKVLYHISAASFAINEIRRSPKGYLNINNNQSSPNMTYSTNGELANIGYKEDFTFTLEDGSKVTKSIRVLNTTIPET